VGSEMCIRDSSMGGYHYPGKPEDPCVIHLQHVPCSPGLPARDQQRAGRTQLFATKFETFERNIRDQLGRILSGGGFDPARDIQAITVTAGRTATPMSTTPSTIPNGPWGNHLAKLAEGLLAVFTSPIPMRERLRIRMRPSTRRGARSGK